MAKNAYFQIVHKPKRTMIKVIPPSEGGEMFSLDEVQQYLDAVNITSYDLKGLDTYLKQGEFAKEYPLLMTETFPEDEKCFITVAEEGKEAVARFYPASSEGKQIQKEEILGDLRLAGVTYGIQEEEIDRFLKEKNYCTDYCLAKAKLPRQGSDAKIEYHFDVNTTAKPKLNEDGSVDFHHLGNIKPVEKGEKLATLTPADFGEAGITVTGETMPPVKVKVLTLRFGRNIRLSEDKCEIYSEVSGHVTLVDDLVMVSDVYEVPANVDVSTGDIEYNGTVQVNGNVLTGYMIQATGDIIVNGVVEGAILISGGNIVLKRGMQGMSKGSLSAAGNITAKFIENSEVRCEGTLMCDAVLHSDVECKNDISVLGRKGLINGGHIRSYTNISATQTGSLMGTTTVLEIIMDVEMAKRFNDMQSRSHLARKGLRQMDRVLIAIKSSLKHGKKLTETQIQYLKMAAVLKPKMVYALEQLEEAMPILERKLDNTGKGTIRVEGTINPGTQIVIKEMSRIISEPVSRCKFVLNGADIKSVGL